jgi:hypothetical protein
MAMIISKLLRYLQMNIHNINMKYTFIFTYFSSKHILIMRKYIFLTLIALTISINAKAQKQYSVYAVGFYNQENLFDTCHDVGKNDYEFLPSGSYHWDGLKYSHKLHNMARVLADMGTDILKNIGCAFIGLSEVENDKVLNDLVSQGPLKNRGMKFCHIEGPDHRGIDCALLYNPSLFTVNGVKLIPYVPEEAKDSNFVTRGFLTVNGTMANEHVAVIVCHWPSRFSGPFYRESAGRQVKIIKDSLLRIDPNVKVFIMGDMNDDPTNASIRKELKAKGNINNIEKDDMYNPWYDILTKEGKGTLSYQGSWNLFDQIIITPNLVNRINNNNYSDLKFWKNQVCRFPYLLETSGKYKGTPKRTTASGVWLDGYSDHLPVVIYLLKEKQQ